MNGIKCFNTEKVIEFYNILNEKIQNLYTCDIWGVAYIVNGGCSDDGFEYFRRWIMTRGKAFYDKILKNPDAVFKDSDVTEVECEELTYVVCDVYKKKTGHDIPINNQLEIKFNPSGENWEESDLESRFPKTYKVYSQDS